MIKLITDKHGCTVAVLKEDSHLSRWVEQHRSLTETDPFFTDHVLPLVKRGNVVIDVGANIGDTTVAFAQKVGPTGFVHAFEPMLPAFVALAVNTRDFGNVMCHHEALGTDINWLRMESDTNAGASHISAVGRIVIPVVPLDDVEIPQIDVIKMDVEGYEVRVLEGAWNSIQLHRPIIITELNRGALARYHDVPEDIIERLTAIGYKLHLFPDTSLDRPQVDVYFTPN